MHKELLKGRKILLGVTGSIAIYKSLELIRLFIKAGAEVKVVMSEDAKRFITPLTFETLSQNKVLHVNTESWAEGLSHIHTGKWAELFVIAPCSVNTINKLSHGIADNLITQTAIAFAQTMVIAPSANTNMMQSPITQESLAKLQALGVSVIQPQSKLLACNDEGVGALADIEDIFYHCARLLCKEPFWENREVIVTGGGTIEKIDEVRCLTNFSSGKQAASLALAYYLKGSNVTLITSTELSLPKAIECLHVKSTQELQTSLHLKLDAASQNTKCSYLLMAAAVSDYIPEITYSGKLKKEALGETFVLNLKQNVDILNTLPRENLKVIGFKAEMDEKMAHENAKSMLKKKQLDAVCLNIITEKNHFGSALNQIEFITKKTTTSIPLADKMTIADKIVELSVSL